MSAFTRLIFVIFLTDLVYKAAFGKECNGPRQLPISGMMLQRHTYNKRMTRSGYAECLFVCREEKVCQSFNFVISENACEFNNRTKEASPKDFVPNLDRYYVKLDVSRVPLGSIPELPAKSCKEIKANEGQATNGKYWFYSIIPGRAVLAYCDMNTEDIDECSVSPALCHANANCQNNVGSYVCTCRGGFIGDGKSCRDIDECSVSPALCHANANCQNNVGSYVCTCRGGFIGDGKSCRDIDECSVSPALCHANANCQNNVGSYVCTCRGGFIGDGKSCRDIDECSVSPALCHANANCQNNVGSYVCTCRGGFIGDGKSCRDIDECASNVHGCHVKAYCTNTIGSYRCTCKSNYHGNGTYCVYQRGLNGFILNGLNSTYLEQLISYLNPVIQSSSRSRFVRCWHAQTDGWAASTFHSNCDWKGPTVTIIKVGSYIFGGYTDTSWSRSSCGYYSSSRAFIYSLYNTNGYDPVKREVKAGNTGNATYSCHNYGPTFGHGHDIRIQDNATNSYTHCGYSYPLPPGHSSIGDCSFYAGRAHFTPTNIEVFYETTS